MMLAAFILRAKRVLIVTPSRMVRDQVGDGFRSLALLRRIGALESDGPSPVVSVLENRVSDAKDWDALSKSDVVVSTVQAISPAVADVAKAPADFFDLIFCDEAHHVAAPTWRALLEHFRTSRRALLTATPFRRDGKNLQARIVFEYPLARARGDGVFGQLVFEPVEPATENVDVALAKATERQLSSDRAKGHKHLVMVRTSHRARADELARVYAKHTSLRLKTVLGSHGLRRLKATVEAMTAGDLDGVICVDMLGEGFDLPALKVAALHSPHRSLAVTLQFIGRFARTTGTKTGRATFLAVPSEIETEAQRLYVAGAEWNEIVEEASRQRIEAERETREVLESFETAAETSGAADFDPAEVDLSAIAPYFHVKILEAPKGVDLSRPLDLPEGGAPLLLRRSEEHQALVCVTRKAAKCRWSRDDRLSNIHYDLYVLFFDEARRLLFVCSSRREMAVYDAIVASVANGEPRRLAPEEVNRVLHDVKNPVFFSVGMRNRSAFGNAESYRMITGSNADRAIQKTDGKFYDRGHCFGRVDVEGVTTPLGFSSASKVWSNQRGGLRDFFRWCRGLGARLVDARVVKTSSNLDHLPVGKKVDRFPEHLVAADWHEAFYRNDGLRIRIARKDKELGDWPLLDFTPRIVSATSDEVTFIIEGRGHALPFRYRLDRSRWFECENGKTVWSCHDDGGRSDALLVDELHEHPPSFFTSTLARLEGASLSGEPELDGEFDTAAIECVDWAGIGINPRVEKPKTGHRSLFEWVEDRLRAKNPQVIFNDDGAGEAADFVALFADGDRKTRAEFYHCKAAASDPVPGNRVDDLYEVTGQAVKSVRHTSVVRLREHLLRRMKSTVEGEGRIRHGTKAAISSALADGTILTTRMFIVQPGVGDTPGRDISSLLAAANAYLVGAQVGGLSVIGSLARSGAKKGAK
jgi:superfamily II DNA or RNA helicase